MKPTLLLLSVFILTVTITFGQNSELKQEQIQSIQKVINAFKAKDKTTIADLVSYPLRREYPLKDVQDKSDLIKRFDDIFDKAFADRIARSTIKDWSAVGWRGMMLDDGVLWIDGASKITAVNYQSAKEQALLALALQADKNQLPGSLQFFKKPVYLIFTKHYKIRIDETKDGTFRYASWKINNGKSDPEIIINKGVLEFLGSGGNHTITFSNNGYTYTVSVHQLGTTDTPDATLKVSKQDKILLTEAGKIKRN